MRTTITTINPDSNVSHTQTFDTVLVLQNGQWKVDASQSPLPPPLITKEEELQKGEAALRASGAAADQENIKILTSCPSCLQGLNRFGDDLENGLLEADYIVVEMANQILGENWMPEYVEKANQGGIERVLV